MKRLPVVWHGGAMRRTDTKNRFFSGGASNRAGAAADAGESGRGRACDGGE
jgi:hypothetical protein